MLMVNNYIIVGVDSVLFDGLDDCKFPVQKRSIAHNQYKGPPLKTRILLEFY